MDQISSTHHTKKKMSDLTNNNELTCNINIIGVIPVEISMIFQLLYDILKDSERWQALDSEFQKKRTERVLLRIMLEREPVLFPILWMIHSVSQWLLCLLEEPLVLPLPSKVISNSVVVGTISCFNGLKLFS